MKKKTKAFQVDCDLLKASVLVVVNCDYKEFEKILKKRNIIGKEANLDDLATADGSQPTFQDDGGVTRTLWLKNWKGKPEDYGRLAHEVTHLVVRIMNWKGIPFDGHQNNDETFAYTVDYFVRHILLGIKK